MTVQNIWLHTHKHTHTHTHTRLWKVPNIQISCYRPNHTYYILKIELQITRIREIFRVLLQDIVINFSQRTNEDAPLSPLQVTTHLDADDTQLDSCFGGVLTNQTPEFTVQEENQQQADLRLTLAVWLDVGKKMT